MKILKAKLLTDMKKVICINNKPVKERPANYYLQFLKEGEQYDVEIDTGSSYKLVGIDADPNQPFITTFKFYPKECYPSFCKTRFVPLSSIDETEFIREYKKELV